MKSRHIQQRFHPALFIGRSVYVRRGSRKVPIHCQQGDFDGACGAYCAAMSLAILGRISDPTALSDRARGVASRLWRVAQLNFFDGFSTDQLAASLVDVDPTLDVRTCNLDDELKILAFIRKEMEKERLVIISWHSQRGDAHHWVLLIGVEGYSQDETFKPTAFLALDPGTDAPIMTGYNGRLEVSEAVGRHATAGKMVYEAAWQSRMRVELTSAISLG